MTHDFYAHVRVGACDIAVPAGHLVQAVDLPASGATPVPRRTGPEQGALAGVVEVEGRAVPIVALERWLPVGEAPSRHAPRAVVLRAGTLTVALQVDALLGIQQIASSAIQKLCHDGSREDLFDAVVPASADRPLLCLLDVARLMRLAAVWCEAAGVDADEHGVPADPGAADGPRAASFVRHVVCMIGDQLWALPATAVAKLARTPRPELRLTGGRVCGIGTWEERKLPFVDLGSARDRAGVSRPWMAVLVGGSQAIGLLVDACERLTNISTSDVFLMPGDELRRGTVMVPGLGEVSVLDIDRLFGAIPEASISRLSAGSVAAAPPPPTGADAPAAAGTEGDGGADPYDYLVFEADRPYASPATGLIGVVALTDSAVRDLSEGRPATVEWRGETLGVVNMPRIDGGKATFPARLAVVVKTGDGVRESAVAVRNLTRWLPARSAHRSSMRMHSVGEVSVVTPSGSRRSESIVVVDLAQMAYLLA